MSIEPHGQINNNNARDYVANVEPDDVSTNARKPLPWHCGTRPHSLMWVGFVWDQRNVAVRSQSGGKKK